MTNLLNHFLLFILAGTGMLLVPLLIGRYLRPKLPSAAKDAIYECGEPTIGSSYIQFDLRFYTVALLFIIFDVEIAFFFPWALVYGNAMQLADVGLKEDSRQVLSERLLTAPEGGAETIITATNAQTLGLTSFFDILIFFGVLMVGFAYVWKRGDLDWIRAVGSSEISPGNGAAESGDAA